jgi:endonuclease/exonuclease/phosphatase family metal-dependent hydrolase
VLGCTLAAAPGIGDAGPETDTFSVLSYNVHGLFRMIAQDAPGTRSRTIGWLASRYDVVMLQEDFEYHKMIAGQMTGMIVHRGNGMRPDARLIVAKVLLFPFQVFIPHFSPPYGAGVTTFTITELQPEDATVTQGRYRGCNGWLGSKGDCWASKGFLRVRIGLPNGTTVDLYNTHLEAGGEPEAQEVRRRQLNQLARQIDKLSGDGALIVAGDLNCAFARPGDGALVMAFRDKLGLHDSGAGAELPFWRERDYILYRHGTGVRLLVEEAGEATEFVHADRALSDHPALFARFRTVREP